MYGWIPKKASEEMSVLMPHIDSNKQKNQNSGVINDSFNEFYLVEIHWNTLGVSAGAMAIFMIVMCLVIMCMRGQLQRCAAMMCPSLL